MGGIQIYRGPSKLMGVSKCMGASKCMTAYAHPLSLMKHAFFVLCMYKGHPNIWGTHMFGCPLNMCGHSHMFGCPHMFGCSLYIHNTKKVCFVTLRGVHMPHKFVCPICLDVPIYFNAPHMFGCSHMFVRCLDAPCTYTTQRRHALSH